MRERTADEYAAALTQLMALKGFGHGDVGAAVISSVVPQALTPLKSMCREFFDCTAKVVGENLGVTVPVVIDNPREVGADRLVNAVAAHSRYGGPLIVVDFGTATTFDVIDARGPLLRRGDRDRDQSLARGVAPGGRQAAADRGRAAAAGDRQLDRDRDAVGRVLGLRQHDRGHGRAHQGASSARR